MSWASALKLHTHSFRPLPSAASASFTVSLLFRACPAFLYLSSVVHSPFIFTTVILSPHCPPATTSQLPSIYLSIMWSSPMTSLPLRFKTHISHLLYVLHPTERCQYPLLWPKSSWPLISDKFIPCPLLCHPGPRPSLSIRPAYVSLRSMLWMLMKAYCWRQW